MKCPVCQNSDSRVLESRLVEEGIAIRRRRECEKCGFRFSTYEEAEILDLTVVKRDEKREAYSRDKLETGLKKSLEKRPLEQDGLKMLMGRIERDIQLKSKVIAGQNGSAARGREISSSKIGEIAIKHLRKVDPVAYIRFASVYKSFDDLESFKEELKKIS